MLHLTITLFLVIYSHSLRLIPVQQTLQELNAGFSRCHLLEVVRDGVASVDLIYQGQQFLVVLNIRGVESWPCLTSWFAQ